MWSGNRKPDGKENFYDHCVMETPLGQAKIEWKSWKGYPVYVLYMNGKYIKTFDKLDQAKEEAIEQVKIIASKCNSWIAKL